MCVADYSLFTPYLYLTGSFRLKIEFHLFIKMSRSLFFSFGLVLSFLLYISCSSIRYPLDTVSHEENNHPEDKDVPVIFYPKYGSIYRRQPPSFNHPRASRNSWFRVSTYQHMKPNSGSDEKTVGDNLMRWG